MTMITLEKQIADQERLLEIAQEEVRRFLTSVQAFRSRLEAGEDVKPAEAPQIKKVCEMVTQCIEVENRLEKCRERDAGIVQNGVAYDLGAARDSIRCKLARLAG